MSEPIPFAKGTFEHVLLPRMANRHGLIAGATGTGKTVTLRVLAERFSKMGVPVFLADVKGDVSGIGHAGEANPRIDQRKTDLGLNEFLRNFLCAFGIFLVNKVILFEPPSQKWGRSSWLDC